MGTRISFQIGQPAAVILHTWNEHPLYDPVHIFEWLVQTVGGEGDELLACLLGSKYRTEDGPHKKGDPVFRLDLDPSQSEYKLIVDPVTRVIVKVDTKTPADKVEQAVADVTELLGKVRAIDDKLNEAEECPTGDTYNDLDNTVGFGLEKILANLR